MIYVYVIINIHVFGLAKKKDRDAWKDITIFNNYKGIIVKDGTDVFYTLALFFAQYVSHILRYTKGIYNFVDHAGARKNG